MDVRACIPTNNVWGFPFFYIFINTSYYLLDYSHSNRCELMALIFTCIYPMISDVGKLFMQLLVFLHPLGKMSIQVLSPLSNWIMCGVWLLIVYFLYILEINPLSDISFVNIFSNSCIAFHSMLSHLLYIIDF